MVFLKKVEVDSVIGYGIIDQIKKLGDMDDEERNICNQMECKLLLRFANLEKLECPKPIKKTAIANWGINGKVLHGRSLSYEELETKLS